MRRPTRTFSPGGKYSDIIDGFSVINVSQLTPQYIADSSTPLMIMATTGLFNNQNQSEGALNIYKRDNDLFGDKSPLGALDPALRQRQAPSAADRL
ncbi:hypothetical protein ACFS07_36385 [Undibacterium arcticum]